METRKDLHREEKLSQAVRKFRCLYDKNDKHFKDRVVRQSAWIEVAREMGLESDSAAEAHWINLRTRFTRQRKAVKIYENLEKSSNEPLETVPNFDLYHMLSWLDEFVLSRNRLSNVERHVAKFENVERDSIDEEPATMQSDVRMQYPDQAVLQSNGDSATQVIVSSHLVGNSSSVTHSEQASYGSYDDRNTKQSPVQRERPINKLQEINPQPIFKPQAKYPKVRSPLNLETKDESDIFGELIASQLKKLSEHNRLQAKHQINNIMFQIQMQQLNSAFNPPHHTEENCDDCPYARDARCQGPNPCCNTTTHFVRVLDDQAQEPPSPTANHSATADNVEYSQGFAFKKQKRDN